MQDCDCTFLQVVDLHGTAISRCDAMFLCVCKGHARCMHVDSDFKLYCKTCKNQPINIYCSIIESLVLKTMACRFVE